MTGRSNLLWKLRRIVLLEELLIDRSERVKPRDIHKLKDWSRIESFLILEGVKVLEQILHLNLLEPEELVAQMIVLEERQEGHLKE